DRTQYVPQGAPAGDYTYDAYIGEYPDNAWDEDHFDFEKLPTADGGGCILDWNNFGKSFTDALTLFNDTPLEFRFANAYPNPFNSQVNFALELAEESQIQLNIYDVNGRIVDTIANGSYPKGHHYFSFIADNLSSGLYFALLKTNNEQYIQKVLLIK
ncbi:MAG: T9SS type A sorting domain-containing protein, partial [FCB group bacterium]|nr:T9SS type A sorting domain-containing protein [FCB group bacterium]